jgi:serine/threonine-protein kinase
MKRCPTCNKDFPDDANFCPVDAGHLVPIDAAAPEPVRSVDTGGHVLLDGRFALGEIVGGHRTGPVYSAGDKSGTTAMVKMVAANVFPSALLKQRTERELKQLERLDHAGVAKVLGHGRHEEALWIATERVDGVPLDQFIAQTGPLPQQRAVALVLQIGSALEAAAKLCVTHRDLSPKNILVSEGDTAKVINFGVPVPGPEGKESVQGVSEYVAPEQIEGRPVDQRCNIYSLGAIATLLLTGKPPFTGTALEVLEAHANTPPVALGVNEGVSPDLSQALLKSLEKASSKRFMTLRQFLGDVEKGAATTPSGASPAETTKGMPAAAGRGRGGEMNKTLMGVAAADMKAAIGGASSEAVGTPAPASEGPAETSIDHEPPKMAESAAPVSQAEAPAAAAPVVAAPSAQPAAPVVAAPAVAAPVVAAPVVAAPSAQPAAPVVAPLSQPVAASPASPSPAAVAAPSKASAGGKRAGAVTPEVAAEEAAKKGNKAKFRETMWFKKGELDEAAARAAAQAKPESGVSAKADEMEMDVRYSDDGSITEQDKDRLSLRTGATMMMEAIPEQSAVKNRVTEDELVSEMTAGRNKILMGIGLAVVAIGIVLAIVLS